MTEFETFQEILTSLYAGDTVVHWTQAQHWPTDILENFVTSGLLKALPASTFTECHGCEQNCFMPVSIPKITENQLLTPYINCDKRDDIGRVYIQIDALRQWQCTGMQLAKWVSTKLDLKSSPQKHMGAEHLIVLGNITGRKRTDSVTLNLQPPICLIAATHSRPLLEYIDFINYNFTINKLSLAQLIDIPPSSIILGPDSPPSTGRREVIKKETLDKYQRLHEAFIASKKQHRGKTNIWHAQQIAQTDIGKNYDTESIRKRMVKPAEYWAQKLRPNEKI